MTVNVIVMSTNKLRHPYISVSKSCIPLLPTKGFRQLVLPWQIGSDVFFLGSLLLLKDTLKAPDQQTTDTPTLLEGFTIADDQPTAFYQEHLATLFHFYSHEGWRSVFSPHKFILHFGSKDQIIIQTLHHFYIC